MNNHEQLKIGLVDNPDYLNLDKNMNGYFDEGTFDFSLDLRIIGGKRNKGNFY